MKEEIKNLEKVFKDKEKPFQQRRIAFDTFMDNLMNPEDQSTFDPKTFDPMKDLPEAELSHRVRKKPGKIVPTFGLEPKDIREGQMIGMFESKQDIFLFFAHRCNDMQKEIDELRAEINKINNSKN